MNQDNGGAPVPTPLDPITLTITLDRETGNLNLQGPLQDKIFVYGLLEAAKEAVLKMGLGVGQGQDKGSRIVTPEVFFRRRG